MKTPIILALSIAGVLGTAGAAMAVNAGTLASFQQSHLGNAPTSLTSVSPQPIDDPTGTATPEPSESAEPTEPAEHSSAGAGTTTGSTTEGGDDSGERSSSPVPAPSPTSSYEHESDDGSGSDDHGSDD